MENEKSTVAVPTPGGVDEIREFVEDEADTSVPDNRRIVVSQRAQLAALIDSLATQARDLTLIPKTDDAGYITREYAMDCYQLARNLGRYAPEKD